MAGRANTAWSIPSALSKAKVAAVSVVVVPLISVGSTGTSVTGRVKAASKVLMFVNVVEALAARA